MVVSITYIFLHPLNHDQSFESFQDNQFLDFNERPIDEP
jgi:hypothetical protein